MNEIKSPNILLNSSTVIDLTKRGRCSIFLLRNRAAMCWSYFFFVRFVFTV